VPLISGIVGQIIQGKWRSSMLDALGKVVIEAPLNKAGQMFQTIALRLNPAWQVSPSSA
jgi:hypothetical protein